MNAKNRFLLIAIGMLVPMNVQCFGRRRKKKNSDITSCSFIKADQLGGTIVSVEPSGGKAKCATCPQFGGRMRTETVKEDRYPVVISQDGKIVQQKLKAEPQVVRTAPVKEPIMAASAPVSKPESKPMPKPALAAEPKVTSEVEGELIELMSQKEYDDFTRQPAAVIEVFTNSCGVCKTIIPVLKRLGAKYEGKIRFAKVNGQTKAGEKIWKQEKIESVPKFYYYSNGKMVYKSSGGCKQDIMEIHLKKAFPTIAG